MRVVAFLSGVVGAWFFVPPIVALFASEPPGAMPVPFPYGAMAFGAVLLAGAVLLWRGGDRPTPHASKDRT